MQAVIQEERTGCAIASVAALAGVSYAVARKAAAGLGITAADPALWGGTTQVRRLLAHFGLRTGQGEERFAEWDRLPDRALLAIKWHRESTGPAWHWVVFAREKEFACVFDSKKGLRQNRRTDFGRMKPKWFIPIEIAAGRPSVRR